MADMVSEPTPAISRGCTLPPNQRVAWEGCSVLLDINDGDRLIFARLSSSAVFKIGNKKCSLRPLIGCPFGSSFRAETGPTGSYLTRCLPSILVENDKNRLHASGEIKNNQSLLDNNTAQGLSSEDIDLMKRDGATGDEIIEALIANSSTFEKKTTYSQEKYKVKKQKKYAPKVLLRRPFSRSICEAYFKKYPARIGSLRIDALSLLLSVANVSAYSDVLVFDMVGGLLTGAVAERLGGTGYVCSTHFESSPNPIDIVRMFNFSSEVQSRIVQASFTDLCIVRETHCASFHQNTSKKEESGKTASFSSQSLPKECMHVLEETLCEESVLPERSSPQTDSQPSVKNDEKLVTSGRLASLEVVNSLKERGFSSLIVAAPEMEVGSLVQKLLPLLSFSAPFVIYHHCLQPLAMCMQNLQTSKTATSLQISEPWLREYQVLPSRTHPHMKMSAFGGYILSGIRIYSDTSSESIV